MDLSALFKTIHFYLQLTPENVNERNVTEVSSDDLSVTGEKGTLNEVKFCSLQGFP